MGMNIGNASAGADPEPIMDINTTPLIDVMLVLLVMLIITIPIQLHNVNLNLPVGTPPPSDVKPEVVKLDIDERSTVYWNGEPVNGRADLQHRMAELATRPTQPEVHIRPHKASGYNVFAEVMVDANHAGLVKLGVIGSEQFIEGR
jgi:biopolymer transport protein ExbD